MAIMRILALVASAGVTSAASTLAVAGELREGSFETEPLDHWVFAHGGDGGGSGADLGRPRSGAHGGAVAAWLSAEPAGVADSRAWASVSQHVTVVPHEQVKITAWLSAEGRSSTSNAAAQLRIEYFEDAGAMQPVVTHVRLTRDIPFAELRTGRWTKVDLVDTVPEKARHACVSVVLQARGSSASAQRLWVDDVGLTASRVVYAQDR